MRDKIAEIIREFYWFARQHPQGKETLDLEKLIPTVAGQIFEALLPKCPKCKGNRQIRKTENNRTAPYLCPTCHGEGYLILELADNQDLPPIPTNGFGDELPAPLSTWYKQAQQAMRKAMRKGDETGYWIKVRNL